MLLNLLRLWTGPLPREELFPDRKINPVLHWLIHPVKRHLARYHILLLQKFTGLKVIAVTGSTGKTTTSGMLYSVLSLIGPTVKTADSTTSTYNLPTTMLKCTKNTKFLILEMGVEYPGDMDFYCWLAKPDIGLLLNVTSVHAQFLGYLENIRAEKSKLLTGSRTAVTPAEFPSVVSSRITPDLKTEIILELNHPPHKQSGLKLKIVLSLIGSHFSQNVAAVAAVTTRLSIPVSYLTDGLESITSPIHRFNLVNLPNGNLLIDDSYNSNPISAPASLETLMEIAAVTKKTPVLIFSQMNELGIYEKTEHEKIGVLIRRLEIRNLYCIGPGAKYVIQSAGFGKYFETQQSLLLELRKLVACNLKYVILIKGSRSWHLENLIQKLETP